MRTAFADITLILPAFNEVRVIQRTIEEAADYFSRRGLSYEIIVAADGDDGTRELVSAMALNNPRLRVIGSSKRRGKGLGIREAVGLAGGRIIGYADADNKVPIEEYGKFEPLLEQNDVVMGSRAIQRSLIERRQPLYRRIGAAGFYLLLKTVIGLPGIRDTQCGFKFFRAEAAREIFRRQQVDGYMFDVEILYIIQMLKYRLAEVPIRWRDDGDSRLDLVRGNLQNVRDLFRIRFTWLRLREKHSFSMARAKGEPDKTCTDSD